MRKPVFVWDDSVVEGIVPPAMMDRLWSEGWRHFGKKFFRYSLMLSEGESKLDIVTPLRIQLADFVMSKSQRRICRKNEDLVCEFLPASFSEETTAMFHRHKTRFQDNVPEGLEDFLSDKPGIVPCECVELQCRLEGRLIAVSYLDVGHNSVSSVYAMFEPEFSSRSLGIFTLLKELEWAQKRGLKICYPGYATEGPSVYDYKKRFSPLESYDWADNVWLPLKNVSVEACETSQT